MSFTRNTPPYISDAQIIAFPDGVDTTFSAHIERSMFAPNAQGKHTLGAGHFVAETAGQRSLLKRATLQQPNLTNEVVDIFVDHWQLFSVGDTLTTVEPWVGIALASVSAGEEFTVTIDGHSEVFTFQGTLGSTIEDAATEFVDWIQNQSRVLSQYVTALRDRSMIHLYASDGFTRHTIEFAMSSGTFSTVPGDGVMEIDRPCGTIVSIDRSGSGKLTLDSTNGLLPAGVHLGVPVQKVIGFINNSIDLTYCERENYALVSSANGVYEGKLPYIDADIKRQTPAITYSKRF